MYALKHGVTAVRFQRFNATRWWRREVAVIQLVQCLPVLVSFLFVVTRPSSKLYWPEAASVRILLKLALIALHFVADLLCVLRVSRKLFESTDFRIMQLQAELQSPIESLNTFADERSYAVCIEELKGKHIQLLLKATDGMQPSKRSGGVVMSFSSEKHSFSTVLADEHLPDDILSQLADLPHSAVRCLHKRFPSCSGEADMLSLLHVADIRTYVGRALHALDASENGVIDLRAFIQLLNTKKEDAKGNQFWCNAPIISMESIDEVWLTLYRRLAILVIPSRA
jgi:hypothetical protein